MMYYEYDNRANMIERNSFPVLFCDIWIYFFYIQNAYSDCVFSDYYLAFAVC